MIIIEVCSSATELRGLKIVFLNESVLDLLLSFFMLVFLTIVAIWFFKRATGNLLSLFL